MLIAFALLACGLGCASWTRESSSEAEAGAGLLKSNLLSARSKNPDSVIIETVLVRFPASSTEDLEEVWRLCNETFADLPLRQRLDLNGLRCGVIMGELPSIIRTQIEETSNRQTTDAIEHAGLATDVDNRMRRLQCRAGRRKDLLVKPDVTGPLTVLTTRDGKHVCGETYQRATVLFDLRANPHGDGSATIELTPEIQHGEHRQVFVTSEFGTRPEMRRALQNWSEMKISARLAPGQILVLSSTSPAKALGSTFFVTQNADHTDERVMLLVRLAESQLDDLFAPEIVEQARAMAER